MAAPSHRRVTRKTLRQPDQFVSAVDRIGDWVASNLTRLAFGILALVAVIAIVLGFSFYAQQRRLTASEHFYKALHALSDKDYRTAEKDFARLASHYSGSKLGRLAKFYLGNTYLADQQPSKARDALRQYLTESNHRLFRQMALVQLAVASEDLGDYAQAHSAYANAASLNGPEKERAEIGVARTLLQLGDRRGAIAAYQRFLRDNPFARERDEATEALAQMGVAAQQPPEVDSSVGTKPSNPK